MYLCLHDQDLVFERKVGVQTRCPYAAAHETLSHTSSWKQHSDNTQSANKEFEMNTKKVCRNMSLLYEGERFYHYITLEHLWGFHNKTRFIFLTYGNLTSVKTHTVFQKYSKGTISLHQFLYFNIICTVCLSYCTPVVYTVCMPSNTLINS